MKRVILIALVLIGFSALGQNQSAGQGGRGSQTAVPKPPISEYKIISIENDTTSVDTSLTIQNEYRFNYLRRDIFELLPFSNVGQTYNRLSYDFGENHLIPKFGAQARHFNFFEVEDINYYRVPTPLTELFFRTVFEQGQVLDAFFTVNTSPNFNFSVAYKGLRSLGRYQHILTSTGNFRATVNYNTRNRRYFARAHFVSQDLMNEENGGLSPRALQQYLSGNEEFQDRSRLDVNFEDAQNTLFGKRFFLNHFYLLNPTGALGGLSIGHTINVSDKEYIYEQVTASSLFGPSYENVNIRDETELEHIYNEASLNYQDSVLGKLEVKGGITNYNYGYSSALILENGYIGNRLKGNVFSGGGSYSTNLGGLDFSADGMINISGDFEGHYLKSGISYNLEEDMQVSLSVNTSSEAPNFNFLLFQSDYINYNWQNDFSNVNTHNINLSLLSSRLFDVDLEYTYITDYAFFGINEDNQIKPMQHDGAVNYFKVKAQKEITFGKFALNNTLLYQNVLDGGTVLNVPDLIARNTVYYQDYWFDRALYLQTGLTVNYFTDYYMNGYDPVLAEFYVQNQLQVEGYPVMDFFFNGKIQQARIFFKLEHINSLITGNNNLSAPLYPYRDFGVRFGLIWNFFL